MSSSIGDKIKIQIFGQSHSEMLGVVIDGLEPNFELDLQQINKFLKRRQGGNNPYSTPRKEEDIPRIVSGLVDGKTCGAPLCAVFENNNTRSGDYKQMLDIPRPSHADLNAYIKYQGANDVSGGGHFSGRMTLPLCFAGAVCMQILEKKGIHISAHIGAIADVWDTPFDMLEIEHKIYKDGEFPVIDSEKGEQMIQAILDASREGDSVGGIIECAVTGLPQGVGEPMFDGIENKISAAVFGIPAVKGIEFGSGFGCASMRGSRHNDEYYFEQDQIKIKTNNAGGILGGISTGMPVVFRVAIKPTPSISREQNSISLSQKTNTKLSIRGRHDPCIVPRAVPCVEAAAAIALINLLS